MQIEAFINDVEKNVGGETLTTEVTPVEIKSEKIKVAVRVRPFLKTEIAKENICNVGKNVN